MRIPYILFVPVGPVPDDLIAWLSDKVHEITGSNAESSESIRFPARSYNPRRRQYLGDAIIADLNKLNPPGADKIIGLADADCYTPGLNFIFGQAQLKGKAAFVALLRLRQSYYGLSENESLFRLRALKEVLHELGHTLGLFHCDDIRCVMRFSNTLRDTDLKQPHFCLHCRALLE